MANYTYNNYPYSQQSPGNMPYPDPSSMSSWYPSGYHQNNQMNPHGAYSQIQQNEQMWHQQHTSGFAPQFVHHSLPPLHQQNDHLNIVPSPPNSGSSVLSSPGEMGSISPPMNPQPLVINNTARPAQRSPFEWMKKNNYHTQPNPGKTRTKDKYRVVYTDTQRLELEKEFTFNNKYITIRRKAELAASLGLSERQVKIWFQNRRAKERKQVKKRNEEKSQITLFNEGMLGQPQMLNSLAQ
ncbi:hypothetical protein ABEB36_005988 [Hypothenemus hampei]|uniref:Homeobox domain-containing protein n=1 Tax=Hypothenemus hampei TaxID=57062 RepID=A0ABD1F041_HYPHA